MGKYDLQQTAIAVPSNISDPYLREWVKPSVNPIQMQLPPGGTHGQFRDPYTPLRKVCLSEDYVISERHSLEAC